MRRHFHKMHGLGNDFVIVDARKEPFDVTPPLARAIADRKTGIGCDQLIVLEPSVTADLKMRIWNHDGGEVQSCGNASRCVIALTGVYTIETGGGLVSGSAEGEAIQIELPPPRFEWNEIPLAYAMETNPLPMAWGALDKPTALSVGNPHLVFFVENIDRELDECVRIEEDPAFPERINVNLAAIEDDGSIRLRTWERGAGFTRACGTGACATAVAAIRGKRVTSPVRVQMLGGSLTVDWSAGGPITMRGGATHVFEGDLDVDALQ